MITAVKPVWTGKEFKVEVVRDVHAIGAYAGGGYLCFDEPRGTLERVKARTLIGSWSDRKRAAVIDWLEAEIGNLFVHGCGCLSPKAGGEVLYDCQECRDTPDYPEEGGEG